MIQVNQVSFSRNKKPILRDVSLQAEPGQCLALLGPSGAGKTSLLRIIAGLERPDSGEVILSGQVATKNAFVAPPEERKTSMIFQSLALWPHMTVAQHIAFVERGDGETGKDLLTKMKLDGKEKHYPDQLSGGEKQRLAIARALASKPSRLLLDEPFSNLDEIIKEDLLSLFLEQVRTLNIASIMVTHNVNEAIERADAMAIMVSGRTKRFWINKKDRVITRKEVLECFEEDRYGK
ncbi:ABC transporter related [Desulfatibacillum aliphaticivorans]|uniref:ABC transporter related n=1 Tax=Desulfatibacillum aliphaticivorans TaxID=218208 RepID=B8FIJ4_DESAL|nr:ATP-binding cassette domain-containing protein [Desulfatibacillum aliphaticivorans]ACL03984.1 ABC transporter related [Desulfatibacillum aliphaticivorans]